MKRLLKKLLCMVLVVMLVVGTIPTQVYAAEAREERLPEIAIGEDILGYDVFYLASASASIEENSRTVYLLRVARGGPADSESTALVKIADMTAKYGEDYVVRVRDERTKVENPEDNYSLMEMIEGSDFEQQAISDEDAFADRLENDPEAQAAYQEAVETALEFLEEASGLSEKYGDDDPYAETLEQAEEPTEEPADDAPASEADDEAAPTEDEDLYADALPANGDGETVSIGGGENGSETLTFDPVQEAANLFTGQDATAQRLTTEGDMFQDLQAIANVMTNAVVGASVELTFREGETEKYLEIVPKDNKTGDGNRMFYVILGAPSGKTTNSAASTCAFTIVDDEEAEPATLSFSDAAYTHEPGTESVTVTVLRSGAMNSVVSARIKTTGEGTAKAGRDYAEADAELVFPFGIDHLTLTIPVRTEYLTGEGWFGLALEPVAGCEVGETASATVTIQGTYTDKAGLLAAENARLMGEDGNAELMAGNNMGSNSLNTIKTLDAIDLTKPLYHTSTNLEDGNSYTFKGSNGWDSQHWLLEWIASGKHGDEGVCSVEYELTEDPYEAFFLAGAQVNWDRTLNSHDHAWMKVAIGGRYALHYNYTPFSSHNDARNTNRNTRDKNGNYVFWYPYDSTRDFDWETRNIYPHENAIWADKQGGEWLNGTWVRNAAGDHPDFIEIMNIANCDDCAILWVGEIKPILRPFQVTVRDAQPLTYLKADGTRGTFVDTSTEAALVEGGAHAVFFMDDTFTVKTVAGTNVRQYAYMSGLELLSGKDKTKALYTLLTNADPSVNTLAYKLDVGNMKALIDSICPLYASYWVDTTNWIELLRDNSNTVKNSNSNVDGVPTYVDFSIRPTLAYLDATVTLRNPYTFPVTFTISGTDYTVAGGQTMEIQAPDGQSFHKGDTLCVSAVTPAGAGAGIYTAAGVRYWGKYQTTSPAVDKEGTWDFQNEEAIYVGEEDQRLTFSEIVLEPNLQAKTNLIRVRVKTSELSRFETESIRDEEGKIIHYPGVLATEGTEEGEYTYFTFANENATFNGKTYAVTATPLNENEVCVWADPVSLKTYEGNTFYFTAGDSPERNLLTLSLEPAQCKVRLQGTLRFANFNLRTWKEGNESMTPAVGAVLAAGSAGGTANSDGFVKTATTVPVTGNPDHWLRYMVSVNGTDIVQEIPLEEVKASVLLDFNGSDMALDQKVRARSNIQWTAYDGGDADAYTITTGPDGKAGLVAIKTDDTDFSQMRYMKLRVRNLNGNSTNFRLYASINGANLGPAYVVLPINDSSEWQDYVVDLTKLSGYNADAWNGAVTYIRFDMGWVPESFAIDYIAFFETEEAATAFRSSDVAQLPEQTIDISSNFPKGVSPVTAAIFRGIQIDGVMVDTSGNVMDDWAVQNGASIPVVTGRRVELTITIPRSTYKFTMTGEDGRLIVKNKQVEKPLALELTLYDQNGNYRGVFDLGVYDEDGYTGESAKQLEVTTDHFDDDEDCYIIHTSIDFMDPEEQEEQEEGGDPLPAPGLIPDPGDRLYLRLTTNRLAQTKQLRTVDDDPIDAYQYADVYTGMDFYQPMVYQVVKMGIEEPIKIEFADLPLVGSTGMNLNFPFVNVGIMKIHNGFRIYIGVSPMQITDAVKKSHITSMSGAYGAYWQDLFAIGDPFGSFKQGFMEAWNTVGALHKLEEWGTKAAAGLGAPSWKFDLSIGIYFDFLYAKVEQEGNEHTICKLNGVGGYVNVALGFQMAWYVILPVVFIPAYFGIEIGGNLMGFLGADLNNSVTVTYDDSLNGSVNINDGIDRINGGIRGLFNLQISLGIGLCGTLGIRVAGAFNSIVNWEPRDPNGSWGWYPQFKVGIIIDLFLFSIPLMYNIKDWYLGSFERYQNGTAETYTPNTAGDNAELMGAGSAGTFRLRESSGDSVWLGDQAELMGAFAPNKDKQTTLVSNAYERPDSQLITLSDGESLALAFLDTDNSKGAAQRTTLKLATYAGGAWSEAVTVAPDDSADFQPSIAETKDGELLVVWVSPSDDTALDLSTDEGMMAYLNSMEVYASFVELDGAKRIKTYDDPVYGLCADAEITRISSDHYNYRGEILSFYDSNPTAVCDMESGDAMVYFIKSGRSSLDDGEIGDYINPYTNDCVVCYLPYNAEEDVDVDGRTVPAGWLTENFYYSEFNGSTANEQYMVNNFGGQRFLDGASYTRPDGSTERYAIPDFTAIAYNGLAVYAYTVDTDGSNDTDADKELYLQIYDFRSHETKFKILLTDDDVADAMPQFFRSRVNTEDGMSTEDESTHTKLFWYRDGKQVVYIDVTSLLRDGINADGSLKARGDGSKTYTYLDSDGVEHTEPDTREYTYVGPDGKTHNRFTEPQLVWFVNDGDSNASLSQADFRAVEDAEGNLYVLWTESVTQDDGSAAREIFGTGLVAYLEETEGEDGGVVTGKVYSGWSKPYRITRDGCINDEITVAMTGENLMVVHNQYTETLNVPDEDVEYQGQVDFTPIQISNLCLVADTLEPCGSVETESIALYRRETVTLEDGTEQQVNTLTTAPVGGETVTVQVEAANNGMNVARGYKLSIYAGSTLVGELETTEALAPSSSRSHSFEYTLPADVNGLVFKVVAQELRDAERGEYYDDTHTFTAEPLTAEAAYEIADLETYQAEDGFHARFTVTNTGNAASVAGDTLRIELSGPANLADRFSEEQIGLYSSALSLAIGETEEYDVPVSILPDMMEDYGFVTARVAAEREVVEQVINGTEYKGTRFLSNLEYADFDLTAPMNMNLKAVNVKAGKSAAVDFTMDLGELFRSDGVSYAVDDLSVARVENGRVIGVKAGQTTLYATHAATGATVSAAVTVTAAGNDKPDAPVTPNEPAEEEKTCDHGEGCSLSAFTDLDKESWYHDGVHWALDKGVMKGVSDSQFDPNGSTSRAMLVTMLYRMEGEPESKSAMDFADVPEGQWYTEAVRWAAENGIVNGYSESSFGPGDAVTREQLAAILLRYAGYKGLDTAKAETALPEGCADAEDISAWALEAFRWAVSEGIIKGTGKNRLSPKTDATRAQVATMLMRFDELKK